MEEGFIKISRGILNNPIFAHQTALKIWLWCLLKATFKERHVSVNVGRGNIIVKLLPGQFIFGRHKAEDELGIDGSTVYKWINKFQDEYDMIKIESNNQYSVISIINWEEYQEKVTTKRQPKDNQ